MSDIIEVTNEQITSKTGMWYYAAMLLKNAGVSNTGINQYHMLEWLKQQNKGKYTDELYFKKGFIINRPATVIDIVKIVGIKVELIKEQTIEVETDFTLNYPDYKLYETDHKPGKNADGTITDDMVTGDLTEKDFSDMGIMFKNEIAYKNDPNILYIDFKQLVSLFSRQPLKEVIAKQIDHFMDGTGTVLSDPILSQAVQQHEKTRELVKKVETTLTTMLKKVDGDLTQLIYTELSQRNNDLFVALHWGGKLCKRLDSEFQYKRRSKTGVTDNSK